MSLKEDSMDLRSCLARIIELLEQQAIFSKPVLSIEESARFLDMPKRSLYELTRLRKIEHYKPCKRISFKREELIEWALSNKVLTVNELDAAALSHKSVRKAK